MNCGLVGYRGTAIGTKELFLCLIGYKGTRGRNCGSLSNYGCSGIRSRNHDKIVKNVIQGAGTVVWLIKGVGGVGGIDTEALRAETGVQLFAVDQEQELSTISWSSW